MARTCFTMTALSPSLFVFAYEIIEQYIDPISAVVVAKVLRSYRRIVVDGGRYETILHNHSARRHRHEKRENLPSRHYADDDEDEAPLFKGINKWQ